MSDDRYDKESVNLWVEEEQKDRWEAYLEDAGDLQHMSQLVRRAVENEISGRGPQNVASQGQNSQLSEMAEAVEVLGEKVDRLGTRLDTIEQSVGDEFDVRELAHRVFPVLPSAEEIEVVHTSSYDTGESAVGRDTLPQIADAVEESEEHVRQALQQLQQDTAQVQTTVLNGQTRYYKEG